MSVDWARRLAFRIRPLSPQALLLVLATVSAAVAIREAFHYFGATLYFSTFFPAVLIAGLFAGLPSGIAVIVITIPLTWWAFLPPTFEFSPLRLADYVNFAMFVVSAGMILFVTNLYRSALRQLIMTESARTLLIGELNHRAGNFLAVMQAIVAGSLGDQQEAANRIVQRINAVARANRMLSDSLPGTITIRDILQAELVPFASAERTILNGPKVTLSGETARSIALVFHELTTNALKHGALSNGVGRIEIRWAITGHHCRFWWRELEGPPTTSPTRVGFGSRMMSMSLAAVQGSIASSFEKSGFSCELLFYVAPPDGPIQLSAIQRDLSRD